jgi:hypothetical protein
VFTYAGWQSSHLASLPADKQTPGADPDGDGRLNLMECALGSDPTTADITDGRVTAGAVSSGAGSNHLSVTYRRHPQLAGTSYGVEVSSNLSGWNSGPDVVTQSSTLMTDGSELVQVRDATAAQGAARRFIRLRVTQTP